MNTTSLLLCLLLPVSAVILRITQRRIFWDLERVGRSRLVAYLLVAPSTIAHELAHAAAAFVLRVPFGRAVGGRVELFRPRRHADGGVTLGQVSVAQTDPLRSSLISIAPFLLVPPMMLGINWALLGSPAPQEAIGALGSVAAWKVALWVLASLSLPLAAFPSVGDHIGVAGAISLTIAGGLLGFAVWDQRGLEGLLTLGAAWSTILLAPAIVCGLLLILLRPPRRRGPRPIRLPRAARPTAAAPATPAQDQDDPWAGV